MSLDILVKCFPFAKKSDLEKYHGAIVDTFKKFDINTPLRQAAFLSQCAHESGNFSAVVENLNYSKEALVRVWPRHFSTIEFAAPYHRKPEKIANRAYRNRMGNGDEASGDGWKYRGRGVIQVTGKTNYSICGKALNVDLIAQPELLQTPMYAILSAGWFWDSNKLNALADKEDTLAVTKRINGGTHGLEDRKMKLLIAKRILLTSGAI